MISLNELPPTSKDFFVQFLETPHLYKVKDTSQATTLPEAFSACLGQNCCLGDYFAFWVSLFGFREDHLSCFFNFNAFGSPKSSENKFQGFYSAYEYGIYIIYIYITPKALKGKTVGSFLVEVGPASNFLTPNKTHNFGPAGPPLLAWNQSIVHRIMLHCVRTKFPSQYKAAPFSPPAHEKCVGVVSLVNSWNDPHHLNGIYLEEEQPFTKKSSFILLVVICIIYVFFYSGVF